MIKWFKRSKQWPAEVQQYLDSFDAHQLQTISNTTFIALDTETTGLDVQKDCILSIGAIKIHQGRIRVEEVFECYVNQKHFNPDSVKIHGLRQESLLHKLEEKDALIRLLCYLNNAVLVAHHAGFDRSVLNRALQKHQLPKLKNKWLDTEVLYSKSLIASPLRTGGERYSLDDISQKFDLDLSARHTASGDALLTALSFLKIMDLLGINENTPLSKLIKSRV